MKLSVAFVLPYGEHADVFFPDTLLAELCARARDDGHEAAVVRAYYDGRDAGADEEVANRLVAWLGERRANVVVCDRLFDPEPLRQHCAAAPDRHAVFVNRGDCLDPIEGIDWVVGAGTGSTRSGATRRAPTIPELVQAFRSTLRTLSEGGDPSTVPGLGRTVDGHLVARLPLAPARALRPYTAEPAFDVISLREPPPLTRRTLFGNSGCPYGTDPLTKPHFTQLTLPDRPMARLGCAFCSMGGDYEKQSDSLIVELLVEQAAFWSRHTPLLEEFVLNDQSPLRYLAALVSRAAEAGVRPVRWLFAARADSFLKEQRRLVEAITAAEQTGHTVEVYLSGFESFSDAELTRYNKGLTADDLVRAVAQMRELHAAHPRAFQYARARGHSLILFGPWTTPEELGQSITTIRRRGLSELFNEVGRNRLRLYEELPVYWAAKRDGALAEDWEDGDEGAGRRKGYNVEHPWRFLDGRMRTAWTLSTELRSALGTSTELAQLSAAQQHAERLSPETDARQETARVLEALRRLSRSMLSYAAQRDGGPPRGCSARARQVLFAGRCNNGCEACPNAETWLDDTEAGLSARVDEARADGHAIVLAGREPAIHPAFLRLVARARGNDGRHVGVVSNGRIFSVPKFALAARSVGLTGASVKVFAPGEDVADDIARARGAFSQAAAGLRAIAAAGLPGRELRAPLHARNLDDYENFAVVARELGATQLRIEGAIDAIGLGNLDRAADAVERLARRCQAMDVPIEVTPIEAGTGRFEWTPT